MPNYRLNRSVKEPPLEARRNKDAASVMLCHFGHRSAASGVEIMSKEILHPYVERLLHAIECNSSETNSQCRLGPADLERAFRVQPTAPALIGLHAR